MSRGQMFRMFSESMLANAIAFEEAGVPRDELKHAVGRDGGTIIGRGVVFQTPIQRRLSEADSRALLESYGKLLGDYNAGRLARERINDIKMRNNVTNKVGVIRGSLRKRGQEPR